MTLPADRTADNRARRRLITAGKLAVTSLLCWLIVDLIDWTAFWATVSNARYGLIALVFLLALLGVVVSAWKWQVLLRGQGISYPFADLTRWYVIAAFFNTFLPTNIGGDGYRLFMTYGNPKGRARAVSAILLERLTGVLTLGFMGYVAALIVWLNSVNPLAGSLVLIGTIAGLVALTGLLLIWQFGRRDWLKRIGPLHSLITKLTDALADWQGQTGRMVAVMALSFLFHLLRLFFVWLLILALGTSVNPIELTVAIFAVEVAAMLPISIGGFGVMEGSFVYVMGAFGLDHEAGLASVLMLRVLTLGIGLLGALLYLIEGKPGRAVLEA